MSGSAIATIVDATAALAATIPGVTAVFGSGQGATDDPLRPGQKVQGIPSADRPPDLAHLSFLPDAPGIDAFDQDGAVVIEWRVPMQLVLPRAELARARAVALPFYSAYISAFWNDRTLGGACFTSRIERFEIRSDGTDRWLQVDLSVTEVVDP